MAHGVGTPHVGQVTSFYIFINFYTMYTFEFYNYNETSQLINRRIISLKNFINFNIKTTVTSLYIY